MGRADAKLGPVGGSTGDRRSSHQERAKDAHRRLLEDAAKRGSQWLGGEEPTRVERVIVGGGLTATLAWATRSRAEGTCVVLARSVEPWWSRREHRLGQPASELVSEGFVLQPHDFADDIDGFAPASALADAIAVTAHEHEMPLVLGCCVDRPIERTEDGRFVVHVGARRIEAEHVDVAVGLGPARRLRDRDGNATIVTEEDERLLLADGRMVFGQDQWQQPVRSGRVLVIGGGATAAWNVERALRHGATVTWVAPVDVPVGGDHARRLRAIEEELAASSSLDDEQRQQLERRRARIAAFHRADLPRNQAVFEVRNVELWVGSVERLNPVSNGVEATLLRERRRETLSFDQVVVSIGQDDHASEAAATLIAAFRVTWLEHDGRRVRAGDPLTKASGRIVGACAVDDATRLRCLGAPLLTSKAWQEQLAKARPRKSLHRDLLRARLEQQVQTAPPCSKGIEGAVFHVSANVSMANGVPIDPGLGVERHRLLMSTCEQASLHGVLATSSGEGG